MSRPRYGVSFWVDRFPRSRRPDYTRHRGHVDADVAVIGGGITGCVTAYVFAAAGVKVALFEADRIGRGSTAAATGLLMQEPEADFCRVAEEYGLRAARRIWQMSRRAALDFSATLRRLEIRCGLTEREAIYFTTTADENKYLRREWEARRAARLEATWLSATQLRQEIAVAGHGGIRSRDNTQLDPYRASVGLARAAIERGARIFEQSRALRIRGGRKHVDIRTDKGTARVDRVVVATGHAPREYRPLARHLELAETYVVVTPPLAATVRAEMGRRVAMLWDTAVPYHYLRWTDDNRVMFGGADQPPVGRRGREKVLIQRTGQLMYELSVLYPAISGIQPEYAWDGLVADTGDGLPYIGPHRKYGRHLFALGCGGNGIASAYLAARIMLRAHLGEPAKGDELFGFQR